MIRRDEPTKAPTRTIALPSGDRLVVAEHTRSRLPWTVTSAIAEAVSRAAPGDVPLAVLSAPRGEPVAALPLRAFRRLVGLDAAPSPAAPLDAVLSELGADERRVLAYLAGRLLDGQQRYGRLDLARDARDWATERAAEVGDLLVYSAFQALRDDARAGRLQAPRVDAGGH